MNILNNVFYWFHYQKIKSRINLGYGYEEYRRDDGGKECS